MKNIKKFENFINEDKEFNEYELEIDNEYSKLKKGKDKSEIDLGEIDMVSDTYIQNMKRTYPKSEIKIKNGRVILKLYENQSETDEPL